LNWLGISDRKGKNIMSFRSWVPPWITCAISHVRFAFQRVLRTRTCRGLALVCCGVVIPACAFGQNGKYPVENTLVPGIFLDSDDAFLVPKGDLRSVNSKGVQLTKKSEGFRRHLYEDAARYCTIAYGHLVKKLPCDGTEPIEFVRGLSEPAGSKLLDSDMIRARQAVTVLVKTGMTDGQYGALCDFVYNVGATNFGKSTLLRELNQHHMDDVPIQFRRWILANGKELSALKARREREIELFFEGSLIPKAVPPEGENVSPIDIRKGELN
jgi:lysozyme